MDEGADFIVAETIDNYEEAKLALDAIKEHGSGMYIQLNPQMVVFRTKCALHCKYLRYLYKTITTVCTIPLPSSEPTSISMVLFITKIGLLCRVLYSVTARIPEELNKITKQIISASNGAREMESCPLDGGKDDELQFI